MYHLYRIKNQLNDKSYIGYTILDPPEKRWSRHQIMAQRGKNSYLYEAMRKYGFENFSFEILAWGEDHKAGLKIGEPLFIEIFHPEYNMTLGGDGPLGRITSVDTRKKISQSRKGQFLSIHTRQKISQSLKSSLKAISQRKRVCEANRGTIRSPETGRKISASKIGVPRSAETKKKLSESLLRYFQNKKRGEILGET